MSEFSLLISNWYRQNKRNLPWRETTNPYFIWLSEIILQQTRINQGMNYYHKFTKNYPTIIDLANAQEQDILNDWQGLGYYSRARNLHFSAQLIRDTYNGAFPSTYSEIIKLKGVGTYTASAIASFAFNEPKAVVDGNVYRLLSRVFDIDTAIDSTAGVKIFQELADSLIDKGNPANHNQAIMEVGSLICTPTKPDCENCPLQTKCISLEKKTFLTRPVKSKKTKVRNRYFHFLIYMNSNNLIIQKREQKDIWQNLYQFPLIETEKEPSTNESKAWENQHFESVETTHILSHQRIYVKFHHFTYIPTEIDKSYFQIPRKDIQNFPLPRVIDRYLEDKFQLI